MKARSGKFINVQVLPNCSAGLDSDNAVLLSDMSELFEITENTEKLSHFRNPSNHYC